MDKLKKTGWLKISQDFFGNSLKIPYMKIEGKKKGVDYVFVSGIHGDELNGIKVIQDLFNEIDPSKLAGNVYFYPVFNIFGVLNKERLFYDSVDLNHIMGGGNAKLPSHYYQEEVLSAIIKKPSFVFDLHSERKFLQNSCFAMGDLNVELIKNFIQKSGVDFVIQSKPTPTTLRGYCNSKNIPCICYEIGSSNKLNIEFIDKLKDSFLKILYNQKSEVSQIVLSKSVWQMSTHGGYTVLNVKLKSKIKKGDIIGYCNDIFGNKICDYYSEYSGYIIGFNEYPFLNKGEKLIHIGLK